jgi:hypothetical protein
VGVEGGGNGRAWRSCEKVRTFLLAGVPVDVKIDKEGVWQGAGGRGWAKRTADVVMVQEVDEEGVGTVRKGEGHAKGASQGAWRGGWSGRGVELAEMAGPGGGVGGIGWVKRVAWGGKGPGRQGPSKEKGSRRGQAGEAGWVAVCVITGRTFSRSQSPDAAGSAFFCHTKTHTHTHTHTP